jgi:tetratricopeptide (TPR) repeat protein
MTDRRRDPETPPRQGQEGPSTPEPREGVGGPEGALRLGTSHAAERLTSILEEIDCAAALLDELLAEPGPDRRRLIETQPRFQALKLCELLLARSREAWFTDAAASVELAELAVSLSDRLDVGHYGKGLVEDTRARAWAHLGNARRIASDLRQAEEALHTAEEHLLQGDEDSYTAVEILSFKASLRNTQGRFEEAAALLDPVIAVYCEARDRHREGRALIQKGTALSYAGRHAEAIRVVRRGLKRIDAFEEPRLLVSARHNLIGYLNESGRNEEALRTLEETRGLYLQLGERAHLVRLRWLEGKIHRDLGHLDKAEAALREARADLIRHGIALDAALVSLDLAMVLLDRGDAAELKRLALEMVPIFESRDVREEALAAFLLFRQAAEAEQVTAGLLQEMASSLERARRRVERS